MARALTILAALLAPQGLLAWTPSSRAFPSRPRTFARNSIKMGAEVGGTALVSGFLDCQDRTDQFVFDVLHKHGTWHTARSALGGPATLSSTRALRHHSPCWSPPGVFDKIVAYSPDMAFAKKRLLSRSARYTGLLNILTFSEVRPPSLAPPAPYSSVHNLARASPSSPLTRPARPFAG